jgi:hypothetical protein
MGIMEGIKPGQGFASGIYGKKCKEIKKGPLSLSPI